jgi:repressor LexA
MPALHPVQQKLIKALKRNITDPLTIRELQKEIGASSPSVVHHHIQQLEKKGYLRRNHSNPKDYQILADSPEKKITYINLYGLAQCGPRGSMLDGNPIDRIPIASKILGFPSSEAFMVKAKGNSMSPKIHDGDLVIARKTKNGESSSTVVCINNGEVLIKKIIRKGRQKILVSINTSYEPFVAAEDFRIEGLVRGVYSYRL